MKAIREKIKTKKIKRYSKFNIKVSKYLDKELSIIFMLTKFILENPELFMGEYLKKLPIWIEYIEIKYLIGNKIEREKETKK